LVIFKGIPLSQCRQCGEQYIPGKWAEKIGEMLRKEDHLTYREIMSVPVISLD
jgi:NMD protein affecting ribosome stability and mRNA decay